MGIKSIINEKKFILSFEVIPPKDEEHLPNFKKKVENIHKMNPDFISVTYGAAGRSKSGSLEASLYIREKYDTEVLSHLTCINSTKDEIKDYVKNLKNGGIKNILALRGDIARDFNETKKTEHKYASDLIKYLAKDKELSIAAAAYPEGHAESNNLEEDIVHLKEKVDCGVDFLLTQFFFDNEYFYRFRDKMDKINLHTPILIGIMPVVKVRQIKNMSSLGGARLPKKLLVMMDKYQDSSEDFFKAGIEYSLEQTLDLIENGIKGVHLYTMNDLTAVKYIVDNIK